MARTSPLNTLHQKITACEQCTRLVRHCQKIALEKRKSYQNETYWGKPVPGFGDPHARLMIVGLAPAAHGANRTGRIFTGDQSGLWLYRALYKAGFSNREHSLGRDDALELKDAYVSCVVRCAPPGNKPLRTELARCGVFLEEELLLMQETTIYLALGQIALDSLWLKLKQTGKKPKFSHGGRHRLKNGKWLLSSYHPSQQNTFTGRLTEPMFDSIFNQARQLLNT
jgi:uracil-DNA glycosylase family 4